MNWYRHPYNFWQVSFVHTSKVSGTSGYRKYAHVIENVCHNFIGKVILYLTKTFYPRK